MSTNAFFLSWLLGSIVFFLGCLTATWMGKLDPTDGYPDHLMFFLLGTIFWFCVPPLYVCKKFFDFCVWSLRTIKKRGEEYRKNKIVDVLEVQPSTYRKPS